LKTLALFDLDHTLLDGDSDVLWCEFLMERGVLDREAFEPRNRQMDSDYRAGTVGAQAFCEFYVGTLGGRTPGQWEGLLAAFVAQQVKPRLLAAGRACIESHRRAGHTLLLTTATNRFITETTALELGIEHLIATDCELTAGVFTGRTAGTLNMREGKVARLHDWLGAQGESLGALDSVFYSDSINDLPLLCAVKRAVAVDPDARLAAEARRRGWPTLHWRPAAVER
jgi:HAD superfamily hydrolase (TIGR01490 family)